MKLLKKLLPLSTIAGVTAIVAPIVTSCAGATITSYDALEKINTKGWEASALTQATMLVASWTYQEAALKNKDIISNDILYGRYYEAKVLPEILCTFYSDVFGDDTTKVTVDKFNWTIEGLETSQYAGRTCISFNINGEVEASGEESSIGDIPVVPKFVFNYNFKAEKIPLMALNTFQEIPGARWTPVGLPVEFLQMLISSGDINNEFKYSVNFKATGGSYSNAIKRFVSIDYINQLNMNLSKTNALDFISSMWNAGGGLINEFDKMITDYFVTTWPSFYFENTLVSAGH